MSIDETAVPWPDVRPDAKSQEFFAAAKAGELRIRRCTDCEALLAPEATTCLECYGTELEWITAAGTGTVVTWTVVHRAPNPAFAALVPYTVAVVELTEGPWLYTRLTDGVPDRAGAPVRVVYRQAPGGEHYPLFQLTEGTL